VQSWAFKCFIVFLTFTGTSRLTCQEYFIDSSSQPLQSFYFLYLFLSNRLFAGHSLDKKSAGLLSPSVRNTQRRSNYTLSFGVVKTFLKNFFKAAKGVPQGLGTVVCVFVRLSVAMF